MLAIGREHGEPIERVVVGDALEAGAIQVDEIDVEVAALRVGRVRREDQTLAVGMPRRREIGPAKFRNLTLTAAIPVHHEQLELGWTPQRFLQKRTIAVQFRARPKRLAAEGDLCAVPREERSTVRTGTVGQ